MSSSSIILSSKQQQAIAHRKGEYLLLAGPGTGKTEVLTLRIAQLVQEGVSPEEILAITFSNKAKTEMIDRLHKIPGLEDIDFRISTLHSFALNYLSRIGKRKKFLLLDEDCKTLFQDAVEDIAGFGGKFDIKDCKEWVDSNKYRCIKYADCEEGLYKSIYERYEYLLEYNNADDITGVVMNALSNMGGFNGDNLFGVVHLLVDEYQDINHSEYDLIKRVYEGATSLFVVGDDDQSIYSWRGADPKILLDFKNQFNGSTVDYLDTSYRCTGNILNGALNVVNKCSSYIPKKVISMKGAGEPIQVLVASDLEKESEWISETIIKLLKTHTPNEIAIITPERQRAKEVGLAIQKKGIKVVFWGQNNIFRNYDVKLIFSTLRIIKDKEDNLALRYFLENFKQFGIGNITINELKSKSVENLVPLWEVISNPSKYNCDRYQPRFEKVYDFLNKLSDDIDNKSDGCIEKIAKSLNINIVNEVREFKELLDDLNDKADIDDLLAKIIEERKRESGELKEKDKNGINVMSAHSSKGLGFKVVFLIGLEDTKFPKAGEDVDEQRRLCYVAMTRAKELLFVSFCREITGPSAYGHQTYNPSPFLIDLPDPLCNLIKY